MMADEDIFDESDFSEIEHQRKCFDKYTSNFYRAGFREAVTAISDETECTDGVLQSSFDVGYRVAFVAGKNLGKIRGTLALTSGMVEEGKLECSKQNLEILNNLVLQIQAAEEALNRFVKEKPVLADANNSCDVESLAKFWNQKISEIFNYDNFTTQLEKLLQDMKCPWSEVI